MLKVYGTIRPNEAQRPGSGQWLDHLQGEVGLNGVVLQLGGGGDVRLEITPDGPVIERRGETVEFRFDPTLYAGSRCRPVEGDVSKACAAREACTAARASGLEIRVELAVATASSLVMAYPMFCCRNALGDRSRRSLCTMSADVRAYAHAAIRDLTAAIAPDRIAVSTWFAGWAEADVEPLGWPRELTEQQRRWLRLCFCESCQQVAQSAGVDVEETRRRVRDVLLTTLRAPRTKSGAAESDASIELLDRYAAWRTNALSAAWRELARQAAVPLSLVVADDGPGARVEDCAQVVSVRSASELRSLRHGDPVNCTLRVSCSAFWETEPSELTGLLAGAAEAGFRCIEIDRVGLLSDADLDALRKAIRFARRIS